MAARTPLESSVLTNDRFPRPGPPVTNRVKRVERFVSLLGRYISRVLLIEAKEYWRGDQQGKKIQFNASVPWIQGHQLKHCKTPDFMPDSSRRRFVGLLVMFG